MTQQVIKIIIYSITIYQGSVFTRHCKVEVEGQWRSSELEDGVLPSGSEITYAFSNRCLGGAGGEGDDQGWDGWMASLTRWTRLWVNSGSRWWTGRPGVLRFMGSQRIGHEWATELNWTEEWLEKADWRQCGILGQKESGCGKNGEIWIKVFS